MAGILNHIQEHKARSCDGGYILHPLALKTLNIPKPFTHTETFNCRLPPRKNYNGDYQTPKAQTLNTHRTVKGLLYQINYAELRRPLARIIILAVS